MFVVALHRMAKENRESTTSTDTWWKTSEWPSGGNFMVRCLKKQVNMLHLETSTSHEPEKQCTAHKDF